MQTDEQIYIEIEGLNKRWKKLFESCAELQQQHDLETRVEEQHRLEHLIASKQKTLAEIEQLIQTKKPDNYQEIQQKVLINNAHQLKRNRAYAEAKQAWQTINSLFPDDPVSLEAKESIDILERHIQEQQNVKTLRKQLTQRLKEIRPIFKSVINRLNKLSLASDNIDDDEIILQTIEMFVNQDLSTTEFIENWETISGETPSSSTSFDYAALARRIQQDEMILFLGTDIPAEYDSQVIEETELIKYLAQEAKIEPLANSLSTIAEYYELRDDYSRGILLEKLNKKLPVNHGKIELYSSLANITRPLILITTAYDNLLEKTFFENNKPYVELSSIVNRSPEHDTGSVVIRYSDETPDMVCAEEQLSNLNLLEKGYSMIYKIRGTCDKDNANSSYSPRQDAMTLMESDYFKFARYADRIIPGYIAKQFRTRDFLFLGFQPRNWEDRLLVNAILEKQRELSSRNCLMIGECIDPFEKAYWDKHKVKRYNVNVRHLDKHLKQIDEVQA